MDTIRNRVRSLANAINPANLLGIEPSANSQNSSGPHDSDHDAQTRPLPQLLQTATETQVSSSALTTARRSLPNSEATRLLGDFNIPRDAQRISFPSTEHQDWEGVAWARAKEQEDMARGRKVGSGPYKVVDTLARPTVGTPKSKLSSPQAKVRTNFQRPLPQDRFLLSSRDKASSVEVDTAEEFENGQDRKRQKLNTDHGHVGIKSDPISLEEASDDGSQDKLVGLNGRPLSQSNSRISGNGAPGRRTIRGASTTSELDNVLNRIEVRSHKMSSHGGRAGCGSQETTSDTMSSIEDVRPIVEGRRRQVSHVEIITSEDVKSPVQQHLQAPSSTAIRLTTLRTQNSQVKAARDYQKLLLSQGETRVEKKARPSYNTGLRGTIPPRESDLKSQPTNKRTIHQDVDDSTLRKHTFEGVRAARDSSPPLSGKFKRDHGQPITRRDITMEADCTTLPAPISIEDDGEQDDMLTGGSTIVNARQNNVWLARQASRSPIKVTQDNAPADCSPSPSDLKETPFRGLPRQRVAGAEHPASEDRQEKLMSRDEFPVDLYWRLYCGTDVVLVWNPKMSCFYIRDGEKLMTVRGSPTPISIRRRELNIWHYNDAVRAALAKCSQSNISGGVILIQFRSADDLHRCHDFLMDGMKTQPEIAEKMAQMVKQQKAQLQLAFEKYMNSAEKHCADDVTDADELALLRKRQARINSRTDDGEERITYEDDSDSPPPRQQSSRKKQMVSSANKSLVPKHNGSSTQDPTQSRFFGQDVRRSGRQTRARADTPPINPPIRWSHVHGPKRWKGPVIYPLEGKERVTVDFDDLERLDEGEFLNDNVIAFGIRCVQESMAPEHRDQVYFFNSFFYTMLMHKSGRKNFDYEAVKRWTKNKDIFSYPYIVVPINVNLHWFVAIICNLPNIIREPEGLLDEAADIHEATNSTQAQDTEADASLVEVADSQDEVMRHNEGASASEGTPADPMDITKVQPEVIKIIDSRSQVMDVDAPDASSLEVAEPGTRNNTEGTEHDIMLLEERVDFSSQSSPTTNRKGKKRAPPPRPLDPNTPAIISLDSFDLSRSAEIKNLKLYIQAEAQAKRDIAVNVQDLRGITAKGIPAQKNFSDCGVYLIRYIEEFAKDPRKFVTRVLTRQMDSEGELAKFDPAAKRAELRDELLKLANGSSNP